MAREHTAGEALLVRRGEAATLGAFEGFAIAAFIWIAVLGLDAALYVAAPHWLIVAVALEVAYGLFRRATTNDRVTGVIAVSQEPLLPDEPAPAKRAVARETEPVAGPGANESDVKVRETQFAALHHQMQAVCKFNYKGNLGDFSSMRFAVGQKDARGAPAGEVGYLLRRLPDGHFVVKQEYVLELRSGAPPRRLTPTEAVERLWKKGGATTDPKFQAEREADLREAVSWMPVGPDFQTSIDPAYRACVAFFWKHPGLYPGISKHRYAHRLLDGQRPWTPPDLSKVNPDHLVTLDKPEAEP